jgi:hypothetical protein
MLSVYRQTSSDTTPSPPAVAVATGGSPHLLHKVFRLSRQWVEHIPVHDLQREAILHLGNLAEDLIRNSNTSLLAMAQLRALLCGNCRHLNAAQGLCSGQSLEHCLLLNGAS